MQETLLLVGKLISWREKRLFFLPDTHSYSSTSRTHFQLAQVSLPILRADFLCHHHLLADVAGERLLEPYDTTLPQGESLPTTSLRHFRLHSSSQPPVYD